MKVEESKILIFHATGGWGGAEKTTLNIAKALSIDGFPVEVLTNESLFASKDNPSLVTRVVPFRPWFESWDAIFKDFLQLIAELLHVRPKILIAMMPYAAFLASMARRLMPYHFIHVASPRGSCLSYLKHFVRSRKDKIRYRIFF